MFLKRQISLLSILQVYAHFYVPEEDVGTQFLVHRKALMRVTDLVRPRMRIADSSIAVLSGNVVEGVRPGRTEIQVTGEGREWLCCGFEFSDVKTLDDRSSLYIQ